MNTETNYDHITFTCSTQFTLEDCRGQFVTCNMHIREALAAHFNVGWCKWETISTGAMIRVTTP
jgi:hypothetical protein